MGRLPDNYFGVKHRITMLKKDYPDAQSAILTTATMQPVGEALCILIKAEIRVQDVIIAQGHAFTDCPEDDKAVEKTETIAIGRALVNAGYPETAEGLDDVTEDDRPVKKAAPIAVKSSGLGAKRAPVEVVEEDEDEAPPPPKKSSLGGLGARTAGKSKPEPVEEEPWEAAPADEDEVEETAPPPAPKPAGKTLTREELLAKYRK